MTKQLSSKDREFFKTIQEASRSGDEKRVLELLSEMVHRRPDKAIFHASYASALDDAGRFKEAEAEFRSAVEIAPESELMSLGLFHLLWDQERYEEALEEVKRFMSLSDSEDYRAIVKEINEKW